MEPEEKDRRLWAKIDVDYFDNAKIDTLSDSAQLLHLGLILKAKKQQKGGVMSARTCKARGDAALKELVDGGLIHKVDEDMYELVNIGEFRRLTRSGNIWQSAIMHRRASIPLELRLAIYERDNHQCVTCGSTDDLTLDHIYPWSLGGGDTFENLQTMCRSCNSKKGAAVGEGHTPLLHSHE